MDDGRSTTEPLSIAHRPSSERAVTPGVVACPEPLAAEAGAEILRAGGNAVDAAIATAFAQGVVSPMMTGIGGAATFLIHVAGTGQTWFLFAGGYAPRKATPTIWADRPVRRQGATWTLLDGANRVGYRVVVGNYTGRLAGVKGDPATGDLEDGSDPRGGGGLAIVAEDR
jgi:gamma-glutamyltranspeptidase